MAINYAYNYAEIDNATHMCVGITTSTDPDGAGPHPNGVTFISIPVYDQEYLFKYYIDGNWYEDPAGTIPWQSSLI